MKNKLKITIINDEISDDIYTMLRFLKLHDIKYVELRTINKKNLIDYTLEEIENIYRILLCNGISVSAFASPLFKWYPDNAVKKPTGNFDTFGFNPQLNLVDKKNCIIKGIAIAKILRTRNIRIFSSLKTSSIRYSFISDPLLKFALNEAQKAGIILLLENELPCYINHMKDIKFIAKKFYRKNLKIWFDVANFYKIRDKIFLKDFKELRENIEYFHLKNFDEKGNYVAIGKGVINYKQIISDIKNIFSGKEIFLSLETHVRYDQKSATEQSLYTLKSLLLEKIT